MRDESTPHMEAAVDAGWGDENSPAPPKVRPPQPSAPMVRRPTLMGLGTLGTAVRSESNGVAKKPVAQAKPSKEERTAAKKRKKAEQAELRKQKKLEADAKQKRKAGRDGAESEPEPYFKEPEVVKSRTALKREKVRAEVLAKQAQATELDLLQPESQREEVAEVSPKVREQTLYLVIGALGVMLLIAIAYALTR